MHNSLLIVDTHVPLCTPTHVSINVDTKHHCNVTTDIGSYEVCVRNEKNMSHFAYACKMLCPLNLVLENSEYLWFY